MWCFVLQKQKLKETNVVNFVCHENKGLNPYILRDFRDSIYKKTARM